MRVNFHSKHDAIFGVNTKNMETWCEVGQYIIEKKKLVRSIHCGEETSWSM